MEEINALHIALEKAITDGMDAARTASIRAYELYYSSDMVDEYHNVNEELAKIYTKLYYKRPWES